METKPTEFFGHPLGKWPRWLVFVFGCSGIFCSFLLNGLAQETLYKKLNFTETLFITFCQFLCYALVSVGHMTTSLHAPLHVYLVATIALGLSMVLTNFSASQMSYVTMVIFRCAKPIPVMFGNIFILKRWPKLHEVVMVLLVVFGLIAISLGDVQGKNAITPIGLVAVLSSLCMDSVASNYQDKIMSMYGASQDEAIAVVYGMGTVILFTAALMHGEATTSVEKLSNNPRIIIFLCMFAGLGSIGVQFVHLVMKEFGSLLTVTVTSLRKGLTVAFSFILFPGKKFTLLHGIGMFSIALGLFLNVYLRKFRTAPKDEEGLKEDTRGDIELTDKEFERETEVEEEDDIV